VGKRNVTLTATHFGISRKTVHKWLKRFNPKQIQSLEEVSKRPKKLRGWEVSEKQEKRIVELRKQNIKYGKVKLKVLYQKKYKETISTWKIERVIRKHKLFPDISEYKKKLKKRKRGLNNPKIRIHNLKKSGFNPDPGVLWHTDSIIIYWYNQRRVIITAIEEKTKLAVARVYSTGSSRQAKDFLERLMFLTGSDIKIIHSDNGSEFAGEFEKACKDLKVVQIYSRVKTPQDNPSVERFNRTLQDEWLDLSEVGLDEIRESNQDLTNWLIKYNFQRPHQTLDYLTPIEYANKHYFKVLPMYPASTLI